MAGGSLLAAAGLATALTAPSIAGASSGHSGSNLTVRVFATGNATRYGPDDLVQLGPDVFVAWQNGVGSTGGPSPSGGKTSTLVEYQPNGSVAHMWVLTGKIDGLGSDPANARVIATVDEDGNSSLYTVNPSAVSGNQVHHYQYAPSPLPHGGGTDSVSVQNGHIFIAASAPTVSTGPALYEAGLSSGIATLRPVFFDNSSATVANTNATDHGQSVTLALTDPDSTEVVPWSSSRFGGDLVLDSQGDEQQIYVTGAGTAKPALSVLRLSQAVDDTAFITDPAGTLYVTDGTDNEVFAVTGGFQAGTALTAVTPADANNPVNAPNYLGQLDLQTGNITPVITSIQAKGLLFVSPSAS